MQTYYAALSLELLKQHFDNTDANTGEVKLRQETHSIEVDSYQIKHRSESHVFVELYAAKYMFKLISHWKFEGTAKIFAWGCKCL